MSELHVVTGAFGYSGKYIAQRLLAAGHTVRTLTNSRDRENPFGGRVEAFPLAFDKPDELAAAIRGARVLYNTYWVRFEQAGARHDEAVRRTLQLFAAAKTAGVERVIHVSITNPSLDSPLPYFRGKAELEQALASSGLAHSILRPTVLFGHEDILVNNIAWVLRRLPVFGVFGDGMYRLQPMHVDDFADLAVVEARATANRTIDAIGPETFTFRGLVEELAKILGLRRKIISVPKRLALFASSVMGKIVGDVILTRDEIDGLMADLLYTTSPPAGQTRLTAWARANSAKLGRNYANELARRRDRVHAYAAVK